MALHKSKTLGFLEMSSEKNTFICLITSLSGSSTELTSSPKQHDVITSSVNPPKYLRKNK